MRKFFKTFTVFLILAVFMFLLVGPALAGISFKHKVLDNSLLNAERPAVTAMAIPRTIEKYHYIDRSAPSFHVGKNYRMII